MLVVLCLVFSFLSSSVSANDVRYRIPSYNGALTINEDNSAQFREEVTFIFRSDFGGQYIGLGTAGRVPQGFVIDNNPKIQVFKNGKPIQFSKKIVEFGDGLNVKVLNSGHENDQIKIVIVWQLHQMLYKYNDVAILNWVPISNWDQPIQKVSFTVKTQKDSQFKQLNVHRGHFDRDKITQKNNQFQFTSYNVKNILALHGAWDASVVDAPVSHQNYKDNFLKIEEKIKRDSQNVRNFFNYQLIVIVTALLALSLLIRYLVKRSISRFKTDDDNRFNGLPGYLSPLMVADSIYNLDLNKLSPLNRSSFKDDITFENVLQATLLDLVDRQVLSLTNTPSGPVVTIISQDDLQDYEELFLQMAFGTATTLKVKDIFNRYFFDVNLSLSLKDKYVGKELENQVRSRGNRHIQLLKKTLNEMTLAIKRESGPLLKEHYRDMSRLESVGLVVSKIFIYFGIIIQLASVYYLLNLAQFKLSILYLAIIVIFFLLAYQFNKKDRHYKLQGVLTEKGKLDREAWDAFRRMLKNINHFEQADIESIIVWNRVLVYANLFGYAKNVEAFLDLHDITLQDNVFNQNYQLISPYSVELIQNIGASVVTATHASHFNVSNGTARSSGFSGESF
ncbi:DUF2207 family protein [Streptococcus hongkongensis]